MYIPKTEHTNVVFSKTYYFFFFKAQLGDGDILKMETKQWPSISRVLYLPVRHLSTGLRARSHIVVGTFS